MTQQNDEQPETDKTDISQPCQSFVQAGPSDTGAEDSSCCRWASMLWHLSLGRSWLWPWASRAFVDQPRRSWEPWEFILNSRWECVAQCLVSRKLFTHTHVLEPYENQPMVLRYHLCVRDDPSPMCSTMQPCGTGGSGGCSVFAQYVVSLVSLDSLFFGWLCNHITESLKFSANLLNPMCWKALHLILSFCTCNRAGSWGANWHYCCNYGRHPRHHQSSILIIITHFPAEFPYAICLPFQPQCCPLGAGPVSSKRPCGCSPECFGVVQPPAGPLDGKKRHDYKKYSSQGGDHEQIGLFFISFVLLFLLAHWIGRYL